MTTGLAKLTPHSVPAPTGGPIPPAIIADVGAKASKRFVEFFTASIHNDHTRKACGRAVVDFLSHCQRNRLTLTGI